MRETEDLRSKVAEHDRDLAIIRRDFAVVQSTVEQFGLSLGHMDKKMDRLIETMNKTAMTTMADFRDGLQVAVYAAALIGGVVSAIVYVAGNSNAAELALLKYQLERVAGVSLPDTKYLKEGHK